jgi:hypothetical protein
MRLAFVFSVPLFLAAQSINWMAAQPSISRSAGFAFATIWDTTHSPLAPIVSMIPRRGQGVAGEGSGSLGQLVEGSLQLVDFPPLGPYLFQLASSLIPRDVFEGGDQLGVDAARRVFRRDPAGPPDGSVEVGPAVAIDEPHVYYAPLRAPLTANIRRMSLSSSRSCSSSSKAASS